MNGKRTLVAALLVTGMVLSGLAIAQAQEAEQQEQQTQQVVVDSVSGEIVSADTGVIVIRTTTGEMRFIMNNGTEHPDLQQLTPGTEVTVWYTRDTQVATEVKFQDESAAATDRDNNDPLEETGEFVAEGAEETGEAVVEGAEETGEAAEEAGEWVADPLTDEEEATTEVERGGIADDPYRYGDEQQRQERGAVRGEREELPATASWNPSLRLLGLLALAGGLGLGLAIRWM